MSAIAGRISPGALLLCNESFASTNEREGSEIARQIIRACTEAGIRVVIRHPLVRPGRQLLRAATPARPCSCARERRPDGQRTFRLPEGEPLPTSYGEDLYRQVFGPEHVTAPA